MKESTQELYNLIVETFVEVAGVEPNQVTPEAHIEEDLAIDKLLTYPRIIKSLSEKIDGGLPLEDRSFLAELRDCETVGEMLDSIEVEAEL